VTLKIISRQAPWTHSCAFYEWNDEKTSTYHH